MEGRWHSGGRDGRLGRDRDGRSAQRRGAVGPQRAGAVTADPPRQRYRAAGLVAVARTSDGRDRAGVVRGVARRRAPGRAFGACSSPLWPAPCSSTVRSAPSPASSSSARRRVVELSIAVLGDHVRGPGGRRHRYRPRLAALAHPLGWVEQSAPFAHQQPVVLLIPVGVAAILIAGAVRIGDRSRRRPRIAGS